jgi:hypothetical protein
MTQDVSLSMRPQVRGCAPQGANAAAEKARKTSLLQILKKSVNLTETRQLDDNITTFVRILPKGANGAAPPVGPSPSPMASTVMTRKGRRIRRSNPHTHTALLRSRNDSAFVWISVCMCVYVCVRARQQINEHSEAMHTRYGTEVAWAQGTMANFDSGWTSCYNRSAHAALAAV